MEQKEKQKHLKIVLSPEVKEQLRRVLWNHGDLQFFFSSVVASLVEGEEKRTIGEILQRTRRRVG